MEVPTIYKANKVGTQLGKLNKPGPVDHYHELYHSFWDDVCKNDPPNGYTDGFFEALPR